MQSIAQGVSKTYGGFTALCRVSCTTETGITALLVPNGAGNAAKCASGSSIRPSELRGGIDQGGTATFSCGGNVARTTLGRQAARHASRSSVIQPKLPQIADHNHKAAQHPAAPKVTCDLQPQAIGRNAYNIVGDTQARSA